MADARTAAAVLAEKTGVPKHDVALVLGSGWVPAVDAMSAADDAGSIEFHNTDLPGFRPPAVAGHAGLIRSLHVNGKRVLAFLGRTHYYESRDVQAVAHGVRVAAAAGCAVTVLTNACGGLRDDMAVG
ncbi:MAG: purine nucleoside phosphorylase, partial [Frankiales bacterium]|nr:purine nucleoside phosphorylase [Frankiales bacterium]